MIVRLRHASLLRGILGSTRDPVGSLLDRWPGLDPEVHLPERAPSTVVQAPKAPQSRRTPTVMPDRPASLPLLLDAEFADLSNVSVDS